MAKNRVSLTEEQRRRNAEILARLRDEERRLFEETRALQQEWKTDSNRRRRERGQAM
ncbi:MAG: hypothetical protein H6666_09770 [Ardenticatenaceae bacterium]|jgi:hypothetical protein|nr:hypothetical protein [Anaerolineales bacterium]MCB8918203.1 hypothetical protein [Ardenticatenaceae bacterium]